MTKVTITRLAPNDSQVQLDWRASAVPNDAVLSLEYQERRDDWRSPTTIPLTRDQQTVTLTDLDNSVDYQLRLVVRNTQQDIVAESATRLVRTGPVPGVVVNYIHPEDYTYNTSGRSPASPSIAMLPDGTLVASHDIYWGNHGQNLSMVFGSRDGGNTWSFLSELCPCFWGKLFVHRGALYMLSTSTEYGALLIRRSDDGGRTWSEPVEILSAGNHDAGGPHKAPMPVVEHRGRLWSAIEFGSWRLGRHDAGVVSAPANSDLLDADNWIATPFLRYDPAWPGTIIGGDKPGVLEGNVVVTPEGELVNILRYHTRGGKPDYGKAIVLTVDGDNPAAPLTFRQVIDFEGNMSKFTIHYDDVSRKYWSLVNRVTTPNVSQRNILTLVSSPDLVNWRSETDILNYEDNGWPEDNTKVGFQYVDWIFDGDDIVALSRTGINGAWNYHNANFITLHRVERFRHLGQQR